MHNTLRKYLLYAGAFVMLFSFSITQVHAQSQLLGPFTPDDNTVILMHFDDSLAIESGSNIAAPDSAIPYQGDQGAVSTSNSSAMSSLGTSLRLENPPGSENDDEFNFLAIPHYEGLTYPDTIENPSSLDGHYEAQSIEGDMTIEMWMRVDAYHSDDMQALVKPGDGVSTTNNWQFDNYEVRVRPGGNNLGFIDGGWHPNDGAPGGNPPTGGTWDNSVQTDPFLPAGQWIKYTFIKDTTVNKAIVMAHDVNGNRIESRVATYPDSVQISDASVHNDIFIGWQPVWNIGTNYPPHFDNGRDFGDASSLGGLGRREFNGNIDELRLSNTARNFGQNFVFLQVDDRDDLYKPAVIPATQDSLTFGADIYTYNTSSVDPTVMLHYNSGSGWQTQELEGSGEGHYSLTRENFSGGEVSYYISAEANGQTYTVPRNASDTENYLTSLVDFQDTRVLKLSFEEGTGAPVDSAGFSQDVSVIGDTTYNTLGFDGTWSYELGANSQLGIMNAPSLASGDIAVDLWFRPSEMPSDSSRLIAKESVNDSSMVNYSIFFANGGELRARASGAGDVELDTAVNTNQWYRALYLISETAHSLQLWNANGELVAYDVEAITGAPVRDSGPLYIGQGNLYPDSAYHGLVDAVEIHNWNAKQGPFIVENITQYISQPDTVSEYPIEAEILHSGYGGLEADLNYLGQFGWSILDMTKRGTGVYSTPITAQSAPKLVPYFLEVSAGQYSMRLPEGGGTSMDSSNYEFGVYETYTQVLDMDFENLENGVPTDGSMYSEFADIDNIVHGQQAPTPTGDAAQGEQAMQFQRLDTSYVAVNSKFVNPDEITMTFWFKPTEFDPDHNGGFQYYRTIQLVTKNNTEIPSFGQIQHADAYYNAGIVNERYSGEPRTLVARAITESQWPNGDERAMHDALDMDSTLVANNWYKVHFEYALNDTAFTMLSDSEGNLIEEVGMDTDNFGRVLKNRLPLTIGGHWRGEGQQAEFFGRGAHFSGIIDNVQIYNYAATQKPPTLTDVTMRDSVRAGQQPVEISATVERNGAEGVYLVHRTHTSDGTTAWDSTAMTADFTGVNYSAELPEVDRGNVVEYWVGTQNDFGTVVTSDQHRLPVYGSDNSHALQLTFENGSGEIMDQSQYGWTVNKNGKNGGPSFTEDAIKGDYALRFHPEDSTYLSINAPYPFLNQDSFTLDLWFKSYHSDDDVSETNNNNVRLISKEGGSNNPWWQQNIEMKGIGGGSWTFGGFLPDTTLAEYGDQFIVNYIDDEDRFGSQEVKDAIEDSTWYHARYIQDIANDSVHVAITSTDGGVVAQTSMEIPGDMNISPVFTDGPFLIGHAGGGKYFNGVVDHVRIRNFPVGVLDVPSSAGGDLPDKFSLGENYPNPFNPTTKINYALPQNTDVTLKVYNLLGREVATLVNSKQQAGRHTVNFDAGNLASGVYFYRISTPEFNKVRKMMLIK